MRSVNKSNILVVGFGGIGTITAYNLEIGGLAAVTGVLRSNYDLVSEQGFKIWSCDHGEISNWRPTSISKSVLNVQDGSVTPFDFVVVCTKNIPDIPPTVAEIIAPAITAGHTNIVLVQNGINIEKPIIARFPSNVVISGISRMNSSELKPGEIFHQDHDTLIIGAFRNPNVQRDCELAAAKEFANLYSASGKATAQYTEEVEFMRWRKLVYNASYNSLCAITGMDTSKIRFSGSAISELLLPIMLEVKSVARSAGHKLSPSQEDDSLNGDALDAYFRPKMEVIVGEVVREAQALGVPVPTLAYTYSLLKVLQFKIKAQRNLVTLPPMKDYGNESTK
ncbi:hypothetical protein N7499_010238 [Penicillium canescens]|uniref:2-dehydropantoate 2-reductase n=1 Tax=Penicillium canescens TaxID=5083 RepID=A0AAD6ILQ2_PENCN|nr:uncharacterized protein N7446_007621 [Penicillium canescens]KAJ6018571.1 hypothetical protein N7522_000638 [Penicillium canescens]KAJ6034083.1 hypothetical protein N7444_011854 [Penicillium canescens]KAJ6056730.1 hypothetical protein N7460_000004 [Penicillium canescens]KAJ6058038.1 hypothetical protein N7446_007621 [Penicillium canescens]KAJ6072224.1 hypothetical protein N7499_010238 [Penicillium canescens]